MATGSAATARGRSLALPLMALVAAASANAAAPGATRLPPAESPLAAPRTSPVSSPRVFRIYGWHTRDARSGVLWLGIDEPYLLKIGEACEHSAGDPPVALALQGSHLVPGRDRLIFSSASCRIDSLRRGDLNKLRSMALTPATAGALRLIQEAVPPRKRQ